MGKRGQKPKGKVKIRWSPDFAYAIGLIASDGCVSKDGRHITFVSKDKEQILNFLKALNISAYIAQTFSGYKGAMAYRVQFGDVLFHKFLCSIGITPAKSKTIGRILLPKKYFPDFLRGCFDGDGYTYSYFDPRWKSSYLWYLGFCSAGPEFIDWLRVEIKTISGVDGHITRAKGHSCLQLKYAKTEAIKVLRKMYYKDEQIFLTRKKLKINKMLAIVGESLGQVVS